jgi:hypothetical protein
MTTELPVAPSVALADALYFAENPEQSDQAADELLKAAHALALVIERVKALETSRIGADDFLGRGGYDTPSFYAGVAFALARVNGTLNGTEGRR